MADGTAAAAAATASANAALQAEADELEATVQQAVRLRDAVLGDAAETVRDVDKAGPMGTTALLMVCTQGKLAEAQALVEVGGADVNLEGLEFVLTITKSENAGQRGRRRGHP